MIDFIFLLLLAFALEMVDNGLGGGFGTLFSPLLILFGYDPRVVIPAILVSEAISGFWGGSWHLRFKNVNFKVVLFTLSGSLIGMVLATFLIGEILPPIAAKLFISVIALMMGAFVIYNSFNLKPKKKGEKINGFKISLLGLAVGFNKGGTGGGYGPLSVSGYIVLGLLPAVAIGTTTVAEGIACVLGVAMYSQITGIVLSVAIPISIGSFVADPISAWINNVLKIKLKPPFHGRLIGVVMCFLGVVTFLKSLGVI